jgi:hypothetical protein
MTVPAQTSQPELVFVPARPRVEGDRKEVVLEMRQQPDGELVLPAYSSLAALVKALGRHQPWACFPLAQVAAALGNGQLAQIVIDAPVDPQAWRWAEATMADSGQYQGRHAPRKLVPDRSGTK